MKKIIVFILCLMVVCAAPLVASAEDYEVGDVFEGEVGEDNSTPEDETPVEDEILPPVETPDETPDVVPDETPEENPPVEMPEEKPPVENPPAEDTPADTPPTLEDEVQAVTEWIAKWLEANSAIIGIIITVIGYGIVGFRKLTILIKSAGTMNNNAITISKNSNEAISNAAATMENASAIVTAYEARMAAMLEAFKTTAEEKAMLERELVEIKNYLKTSTDANIEFANELADLIALANVPNYKKEELGKRHVDKVNAILEAEKVAEIEADNAAKLLLPKTTEEVKENDGEEA